jgi:hypothetical protein
MRGLWWLSPCIVRISFSITTVIETTQQGLSHPASAATKRGAPVSILVSKPPVSEPIGKIRF